MDDKMLMNTNSRKDIIKTRIKGLRLDKQWSLREMGEELNSLIGYESNRNIMKLDDKAGKETVSQLENGKRNITIELAVAYADIFNVSLDYILGRADNLKPEYEKIETQTGLSDNSLQELCNYNAGDNNGFYTLILNSIFEDKYIFKLVEKIGNSILNMAIFNCSYKKDEKIRNRELNRNSKITEYEFSIFMSEFFNNATKYIFDKYNQEINYYVKTKITEIGNLNSELQKRTDAFTAYIKAAKE